MYKKTKLSVILRRATLIQGAMFIVLPNVPGATFIKGGTFIPESRADFFNFST